MQLVVSFASLLEPSLSLSPFWGLLEHSLFVLQGSQKLLTEQNRDKSLKIFNLKVKVISASYHFVVFGCLRNGLSSQSGDFVGMTEYRYPLGWLCDALLQSFTQ